MTCSLCGDACRCTPERRPSARSLLQPGLPSEAPQASAGWRAEVIPVDPDAADTSEQPFATSLERDPQSPRPRFIVDGKDDGNTDRENNPLIPTTQSERIDFEPVAHETSVAWASGPAQPVLLDEPETSSWRDEVSERLHRYRARRRPRAPRYPSLRLNFEAPETVWVASPRTREVPAAPQATVAQLVSRQSVAMDCLAVEPLPEPATENPGAAGPPTRRLPEAGSETTAKIIAFPRSNYAPPVRLNELAEPVIDRPRILEAPEVVPPPPALGGITIEEAQRQEPERRLGIDMPLQSALLEQRLLAIAIDAAIVLLAGVVFGAILHRIAGFRPPLLALVGHGLGLLAIFWAAYQYLLIVYSGTTPGLRAMKLQLQRFDGSPPNRPLRRWRVLGSLLSGVSLGMGYAWQFLDEDSLCWHERVTKTYLAPERP